MSNRRVNRGAVMCPTLLAPDRRFAMIMITGATGNVGRPVVNQLAEGQQVVAVSRHPPQGMFPAGARVIEGDPSRPETLAAALSGIEAILLSPRAVGAAASRLLTLAAQRGVRRAVARISRRPRPDAWTIFRNRGANSPAPWPDFRPMVH